MFFHNIFILYRFVLIYNLHITNWTGNALSGSTFGPIVCDFDATRPQATITLADGQSADTTGTIGKFLFTFSEAIDTGTFTCDDISLDGTASSKQCTNIEEVSPNDGTSFEVSVSTTSTGTIIVDLDENKVEDLAKNPNSASITTENTITINETSTTTSYQDGLILYLPLDFDTNDHSGNGNHGNNHGAASTVGHINGAYNLDGNAYISVPQSSTLNHTTINQNFTISFWGALPNNTDVAIVSQSPGGGSIPKWMFAIQDRGTNIGYYSRDGNTIERKLATYTFTTHSDLQHYTLVKNGNNFFLYHNGVQVAHSNENVNPLPDLAMNFEIGRAEGNFYYNNILDELAIRGRALSSTEVVGLYNGGAGLSLLPPTISYILTYTAGVNGALSGNANQTLSVGEDGTAIEAIADSGYYFIQRSDGRTDNPRTDLNVTGDVSVSATFIANSATTYNLTYSAGANGIVSGNLLQTVEENSDGSSVEAIADTGYHFVQRSDSRTDNPRTDLNVIGDISVSASFEADAATTYNLTYSAGANGIVSGNLTQTVDQHNNGTPVRAIADDGYHFKQRSDGNTDNPRIDLNVTTNISVSAMFEIDESTDYVSNNSRSTYLSKDRCPGGDLSPSYYDGYCGEDPKLDETTHGSATKEKYVYYPPIKRYQLAMFVGKIANSLLTLNANDIECDFEDIKYLDNDTKAYIVHSCKHGIMGINADGLTSKKQFEPENIVSYNELATVLSRLLYGVKYNYETVWYEKHVEQIEKIGLLSKNDLITIESVAKIFSIIYKNPSMIER